MARVVGGAARYSIEELMIDGNTKFKTWKENTNQLEIQLILKRGSFQFRYRKAGQPDCLLMYHLENLYFFAINPGDQIHFAFRGRRTIIKWDLKNVDRRDLKMMILDEIYNLKNETIVRIKKSNV